ncbi:type I DNA topoisomerase [Candidatus Peregrinibacteria bacterium]|nr:type I DNA topoisomerase [Candidatus Peregrinibacteria bacterium]
MAKKVASKSRKKIVSPKSVSTGRNLVIVESPAKAKTISHFLGRNYLVKASFGHIRDLPKSRMGVDTEHDFQPNYGVSKDKLKVITELKTAAAGAPFVWIATDEDREGEAIGWHLVEALHVKSSDVKRIVFHEITEEAIRAALSNPRNIDKDLVDSQQARRILDRLVGYELSPLLWKKVRWGLSAGRVQSVAVRLIVEREREISAFKPEEYWDITAIFHKIASAHVVSSVDAEPFPAALFKKGDIEVALTNGTDSENVVKALQGASYSVQNIEQKEVRKSPPPPFITSTLQQEASRKLGFSVKKTMVLAQKLYEGVAIGQKRSGLITYMRTDSVHLAESALAEAREVISRVFGAKYALEIPRRYKSGKGAQEAHEAIRPTAFSLLPSEIKSSLERDEYRLYELIWNRAVASQMPVALLQRVSVDILASKGGYVFRANGQTVAFDGYRKVYVEAGAKKDQVDRLLPHLEKNEALDLQSLSPAQHFTKPPARYTEASLVKKLEELGIGRPSTYAPTISTIMNRGYVAKEEKSLKPTDTGMVVTDVLIEHFPEIVDYMFTAQMEEDLDLIAEGKKEWVPIIRQFYDPFHKLITEKMKTIQRSDVISEKSSEVCDKCGSQMMVKLGRFGKFLSCSRYPECKNARPLKTGKEDVEKGKILTELEKKLANKKCDKCGKPMVIKVGKYGEFLGCSGYPECKNIQPIVKFTGVSCPKCHAGQLVERRTKKGGRVFYGCNKYPKCHFAVWDFPVKTPCLKCQGLMVEKKSGVVCTQCEAKQ